TQPGQDCITWLNGVVTLKWKACGVTFGINLDRDFGTPFPMNQITQELASFQEQIDWVLRVASLIVGLMVGAMSLIAMVKKMRGR
ncbi:MAG: hypothetical protein ACOVQU_01355, partial [Exiguobacterium acetylicum]